MKYRKVKFKKNGIECTGRFHQFGKGPYADVTMAIVEDDTGKLYFIDFKNITFTETPEGIPYPAEEPI